MSDKRKIIWIVLAVFIFSAVANVAALGLWARAQFDAPGPLPEIKTIVIAKGSGLGQIAGQLESGGVIDHDWLFKIAVLLQKRARQLKPGEYEFAAAQSMRAVIDQIADAEIIGGIDGFDRFRFGIAVDIGIGCNEIIANGGVIVGGIFTLGIFVLFRHRHRLAALRAINAIGRLFNRGIDQRMK